MKKYEVDAILRNEKYYRQLVSLSLFEEEKGVNLGVQNNVVGNSTERNLINKFENREYLEAKRYIETIDKMMDSLEARERLIYVHRYRYRMSVERISYELHYSKATIWAVINSIKVKFIKSLEIL